jgi:hypothetical protein
MKGFEMSLDTAMRFYKLCAETGAKTIEERLKIMNRLIHEENIRILNEKQIIDTCKTKKVLRIKK